ncbi:hypothetical protein [Cupriavidus basilensis]|uniref:hypothetical protein n=1 Tax=Cupriavidus basilensis TaxID=68895 RepID=UPI000A95711B|nr:hypothetical protein [Cupriavidus basilensis]
MEQVVETTSTETVAAPNDGAPQETQQPNQNAQPPEWVPKRMGEMAAARRAAEQRAEQIAAENARLQQQLAALQAGQAGDGSEATPVMPAQQHPNVEQLARTYAEQMIQQRMAEQQTSSRIAEVDAAARKEFGTDYDTSVQNLTMAGIGGPEFLSVITSVPNPEKLVTWLGKSENLGEAMRVMGLSPMQMGIEMTKLAGRAAKEMTKQVSKAPPPVEGVDGGSSGGSGGSEPKMGTPEWFAWRNKNARRRR